MQKKESVLRAALFSVVAISSPSSLAPFPVTPAAGRRSDTIGAVLLELLATDPQEAAFNRELLRAIVAGLTMFSLGTGLLLILFLGLKREKAEDIGSRSRNRRRLITLIVVVAAFALMLLYLSYGE
jgi:hypothetical protein